VIELEWEYLETFIGGPSWYFLGNLQEADYLFKLSGYPLTGWRLHVSIF